MRELSLAHLLHLMRSSGFQRGPPERNCKFRGLRQRPQSARITLMCLDGMPVTFLGNDGGVSAGSATATPQEPADHKPLFWRMSQHVFRRIRADRGCAAEPRRGVRARVTRGEGERESERPNHEDRRQSDDQRSLVSVVDQNSVEGTRLPEFTSPRQDIVARELAIEV